MFGKLNVIFMIIFIIFANALLAQTSEKQTPAINVSALTIDMQWFLSYLNGERNSKAFNEFALKRGYVNIKKKINNTFSGRITTDITIDKEGDGKGDVEMRLKYLYLKTAVPSFAFFHKPYFEIGLVHRPWLDFEQHINLYRVQGTLFLERTGVISSGDYGIVFLSYLGGEMDDAYKSSVNKSFAGKYGSMAVGIFNGGGYHALENNANKTLEGRLTLRPLPNFIPGFQITWHGAYGKGNIDPSPDWNYNSAYISYEKSFLVLTTELYRGKGNYKGSAIQDTIAFEAVPQHGFSLFGELKLFKSKFSLLGRYDQFTQDLPGKNPTSYRTIAGVAYHFLRGSKILFDYDRISYSKTGNPANHVFELAIELKY